MANPSPDEGVRAALVQVLTYLEGQHAKTKSNGVVNADVRRTIAALSTPVPVIPMGTGEGLPRGTASAAEVEPVAWFYEFLGHNDQWIADVRLAKPKAPSGGAIRNVRPLSFASALPSPLPSQGELVAFTSKQQLACLAANPSKPAVMWGERSQLADQPLCIAEAEADAETRADGLKRDLEATREALSEVEGARATLEAATVDAEARADRAEEALKPFVEHADAFSHLNEEVVIYGSGGLKITVGDLLRARTILKETPHG